MNENNQKFEAVSFLGTISSSLYVSFQLIANVLSTKITILPVLGWAIDSGTIIYPLTFTLRDFVHKTLGKQNARKIVVLAGVVNVAMALLLYLVGLFPSDSSWQFQQAYQQILLPVWRITMASILAQVVSELVDTEIFSWAYKKYSDMNAVLLSNAVALVVDSLIFSFVAFYGDLPLFVVWQIVGTNILIKVIMSLLSAPGIKLVPRTVDFEKI